jgi:hypothetical protein
MNVVSVYQLMLNEVLMCVNLAQDSYSKYAAW